MTTDEPNDNCQISNNTTKQNFQLQESRHTSHLYIHKHTHYDKYCNFRLDYSTIQQEFYFVYFTMDYEGQKLAELLFYYIILSCGGVGWILGYIRQDFTIVFQIWLIGVIVSVIVRIFTCIYPYWDIPDELSIYLNYINLPLLII